MRSDVCRGALYAVRQRKINSLACGFLAASLALASPAAAADIKVGGIYSIEGIFSVLGGSERDGALLAVQQLNEGGGVDGKHIDLTIYDDGGDQAKAVQLANRLVFQDKVSAVFGPTITPTSEMVAPILEQNKVLEIGLVSEDDLWKDTQYVFMSTPTDAVLAREMVSHAWKSGARKISIAYANVPYGVSGAKVMRQAVTDAGAELVGDVKWGEGDIDFTPAANQLHAAKADAILVWGSCNVSDAQVLKALRDTGDATPFVGNLCLSLPSTAEIMGKGAEGAVSFSLVDYSNPSPRAAAFLSAYSAKFTRAPLPIAAAAYDGVQLWAQAVRRAGGTTDPVAVADAMIGLDYDGVTGHFHMSKDRHAVVDPSAYKAIVLKNGVWITN